jgi:hypothetical protein
MPRKGPVTKRDVLPDPVYGSKLLTRFINKIMLDGKKGVAERIVYDAFDLVRAKTGKDPLEVFDAAMKNVMPLLEVRAPAALAVLTTRFRLKSVQTVRPPLVFAGWSTTPVCVVKEPCANVLLVRSWTQQTLPALL